jgi:micrococcal nuclease
MRERSRRAWLPIVLLLGCSAAGCLGFGGPLIAETDDDSESESETGPASNECGPTSAVVAYVVDGDTIVLESGDRVRYILVDTPEVTNGSSECYGDEARDYNDMLVTGQSITLVYDEECRDNYGRLLAYVSVGELEVNRTLLENGYACILHISPNGDDRVAEYQALEDMAKAAGVGMWSESVCGTVACD